MANAQQQQLNSQQENALMRQLLVQASPLMIKKVGTFTGSLGGTTRMKLFNVGLITRLFGVVTMNITIGTANATYGPKTAAASISRLKLTDFDGTDRINCNGFQLFQRNSLRLQKMDLYGFAGVVGVINNTAGGAGLTNPLSNPLQPSAVATNTLRFFFEVPVCRDIDAGDLRGMILAQTAVGELYLSIDWASALYANGNDDYVYNGAATTTVAVNSISVDLYQEYFLPQQNAGVIPIPMLDVMTVYELNGNLRSSDNLAAGSEKLLSFPNARQIVGVYASYLNNGVLGGSPGNDMSVARIIANGNNILREYQTIEALYMEQRRQLGTDLPKGVYVFDWARTPIQTNLYGNIQLGLTPGGTLAGTPSVEIMYESLYLKGAALSGLSQSG